MTEPSDEELLNRYFAGDAEAAHLFIERHSGRVIAYAETKGLRREIAVEVAQEAFLKLHRFIHQYERGRPALSWFFTIVHRCIVDVYRQPHQQELATASEFFESMESENHDSSEKTELLDAERSVDAMLIVLSLDQQKLVRSRVLEGLSFKEIASSTGKTEVSLRKMYERARSALKTHLGEKSKNEKNT